MLFSNNRQQLDSLLWGSTVGYLSDSLASCSSLMTSLLFVYMNFVRFRSSVCVNRRPSRQLVEESSVHATFWWECCTDGCPMTSPVTWQWVTVTCWDAVSTSMKCTSVSTSSTSTDIVFSLSPSTHRHTHTHQPIHTPSLCLTAASVTFRPEKQHIICRLYRCRRTDTVDSCPTCRSNDTNSLTDCS